jgi:succinate dehydrogenase / fumarate reductase cytochrome b subunit
MAITGLLLCGFLVAHLAGNLLLYAGDNGHSYNEYAHALHKQAALLAVAEVGLVGLFIAHIVIALSITRENRAARKVGYAMRQSKQEGRIAMEGARPDLYMALTGAVILGFLILHLMDFRLELRDAKFYEDASGKDLEPYDKAMALLSSSNLITIAGYALGSFALLAHLAHGFQSAFQTLGLNHPKYTPHIKTVGLLFALVIGVGFASFPIGGLFNSGATTPSENKVSARLTKPDAEVLKPPPGTLEGVDVPDSPEVSQ